MIIHKSIRKKLLTLGIAGLLFCNFIQAQEIFSDSLNTSESSRAIAYGYQPDWKIAGAISSVKGDDLAKSFVTNVANSLYGRIPGLTVGQRSSEPGNDTPTLNSRGLSTFGSGRDICIIIDGFPATVDFFQQLTFQEIESISLLKDAASAAIYGNKAANGVLLVKTKRGNNAPLRMNFSAQYGLQEASRLPDFLDSYNYAKLHNEAMVNDFGYGSEIYSQAALDAYRSGSDPVFYPNVNWYKQLLRDQSPMANFNLNAIGGSNTVNYFVLLNVATNSGLYKPTEKVSLNTKNKSYMRYNFRTNVDIKLAGRLTAEVTLGGSVEDRTNPGRERTVSGTTISGEYTTGVFDLMSKLPPNAFPVHVQPGMLGGNSLYQNPWGEITETGYYSTNKRAAQLSAKVIGDLGMITPGLSISGAIGFNTVYKSYSIKSRDYARYSVYKDGSGNTSYTQYGENTSLSGNESPYSQWRNFVLQGFLDYKRDFGVHGIDAMLMAAFEEYTTSATHLPFKDIVSGGRLTYSLDKKYTGEFSFAYSGTDNFAPGNRFGLFPAGAIGWIISNESFLKDNPFVNYLKLRASYGLTGNKETGSTRFPYLQYYTGANYYLGTGNAASYYYLQNYLAYKDATWEKDKKLNVGIETKLCNMFDVGFDYFKENRYDILAVPYSLYPSFSGFTRPSMNIGKVENKGFEAVIRYNSNKTKDLTYFVEGSVWYARNKITYNSEEIKLFDYQYRTGNRIDQPYLLEALGFFYDAADVAASPAQLFSGNVQQGDIKYKNQNPEYDNIIDQNDFVPSGYTNMPEYTLGLHAGANYKGFDLDIMFQGALNRSVYFGGSYFEAFQNDGQVSSIALGRWQYDPQQGIDNRLSATYPRLSANNNQNNYQQSSFWQKNGNFLKLRSLEIGYTLPKNITKLLVLEKSRVFLNGTNLFSIDYMDGFTDPETLTGYPAVRTFSIGVSIHL